MMERTEEEHDEIMVDGNETAGFLVHVSQNEIIPKIIVNENDKDLEKGKMINVDVKKRTASAENDSGDPDKTNNNNNGSIDDKKSGSKQLTGRKRYLGIGLGVFSSLVFSLGVLIVKILGDSPSNYHPFNVALWRFFGGVLVPSIPVVLFNCWCQKKKVFQTIHPICQPDKLKMFSFLFLRAFAGCGAVVFHYYAMRYLSMSDATVIAFATPVFVTFLAHFFLSEQCGVINVLSGFVTFLGVMVITRPPFLTGEEEMDTDLMIGAGMALASMTFASCVFLTLRVLKGINYSVVTLFFGLYGTLQCAVLSAIVGFFQFPQTNWELLLTGVLGIITFIGQISTTLALKYEEAGVIALTRCFDVVFSFVWQLIFLGIVPGPYSFIGSLIVMMGVFLIVLRKYVQNLHLNHPTRQRLSCILK